MSRLPVNVLGNGRQSRAVNLLAWNKVLYNQLLLLKANGKVRSSYLKVNGANAPVVIITVIEKHSRSA